MKGRNAQVARLYKILHLLQGAPHGLSAQDIRVRLEERGFDFTIRTIYRDLEALQSAGFPLSSNGENQDQGTKWTIDRTVKFAEAFALTVPELFSLYFAKNFLTPLRALGMQDSLDSLFSKIETRLGQQGLAFLSELSGEVGFDTTAQATRDIDPEIVDTLVSACAEGQMVHATYHSASSGSNRQRKLGPEFLYFAKGSLYLIAQDQEDQKAKVFAVPRISAAEMLDEPYETQNLEPDDFFSQTFGVFHGGEPENVEISFSPALATYISERQWHKTQQVSETKDGRTHFRMEVAVSPELIQWVLGFGSDAIAVGPERLKEAIKTEVQKLSRIY